MAIRTYKVTLDSNNTIAPEPVLLRQGDKTGAVVIDATLMDNGSPVSLSGLTPMFKANTADGQAVIADSTGFSIVNASGGEFNYQVPNALSSVPGKIVTAYFSFSDSSGSESTFDVAFVIKKAVDVTQAQADDYITIIDGTLRSLQQKVDAMNTDVQTILNAFNQGDFYNKSQTDSKDAATLASAKSYSNSGDAATLASAKSYSDSGDAAIPKKVEFSLTIADKAGAGSPSTSVSGTVWREGDITFLNATYSTNGSGASGTVAVIQVPAGFRPNGAGKNYFLQNDASKFCYITSNGVVNSVATNSVCSITGSWPTADDFPE